MISTIEVEKRGITQGWWSTLQVDHEKRQGDFQFIKSDLENLLT